jgi:DNA-directed RNA polymerase specialized sigma24 family protein
MPLKLDEYDTSPEFVPWACNIAWKHIRNFWRKRQNVPLIFDEPLLLKLTELRRQDDELLEQRQRALGTCLKQLKPHARAAIERYYQRRARTSR